MNTRKSSNDPARNKRLMQFGAVGLVGLIVAGFAVYWFLFRDTSALSVNTVEAAAARQSAIDEAVGDGVSAGDSSGASPSGGGDTSEQSIDASTPDDEAEGEGATELDDGQPDAAASFGGRVDGLWEVDTSIGTFNDACLTDACSSTFVGFRINEELAGFGAKTVVGRTPGVSGSMEIEGTQIVAASFVVDMTGLATDTAARTSALRGRSGGLETDTFPEAIFVLTEPIELGEVPAEGTEVSVTAVGDLTVHGVTRKVSIPLTAEHQAGVIVVFGVLEDIALADFEIPKPSAAVVLSIEEIADMELQLFFNR